MNLGTFVGAGGLRSYVIGDSQRAATADELEQMKALVRQAMEQGALGLSTSLQYVPDRFASTDEIVELAKVAAEQGGRYLTHQRSESNQIIPSLDEAFAVAERAHIPTEVWHLKTAYRANWGRMPEILRHIEAARARGLDVSANIYPYDRASNGLDACLPLWVREGGIEPMLQRLKDPAQREKVKRDMEDPNPKDWENQWYGSGGAAGVLLSSVLDPSLRKWEGKTLEEIGREMGKDPRDAVMDLVIADRAESSVIISIMREDDVRTALAHPLICDRHRLRRARRRRAAVGVQVAPARLGVVHADPGHLRARREADHPRGRDPALHLAPRVAHGHRGSRHPASRLQGRHHDLRPGRVRDVSTYTEPNHYSEGILHVLVNGQAVVSNGKITAERPGEALRGPGARPATAAAK